MPQISHCLNTMVSTGHSIETSGCVVILILFNEMTVLTRLIKPRKTTYTFSLSNRSESSFFFCSQTSIATRDQQCCCERLCSLKNPTFFIDQQSLWNYRNIVDTIKKNKKNSNLGQAADRPSSGWLPSTPSLVLVTLWQLAGIQSIEIMKAQHIDLLNIIPPLSRLHFHWQQEGLQPRWSMLRSLPKQ